MALKTAENLPVRTKKKRVKMLRPSQILGKKRVLYEFKGKWLESFGRPEQHMKWFITGPPFSGKSSLVFELCNMLTEFGRVDYNNHEEAGGDADTVAKKLREKGLADKDESIRLYKAPIESDVYETWDEILSKKQSSPFGVLDSLQHAGLTKIAQFLKLVDKYCTPKRGKSLIFISHFEKNEFTKFVKHDCDIKVEVIGFVAHVESRATDAKNKPFIIYEEGAKQYWGKNYKKVISGAYWPGRKK